MKYILCTLTVFSFTREVGHFKPFVRNKSQTEGCIANGHIAEDTLTFCSYYMEDIETRFNKPRRVRDDQNYIQPSGMSTIFPQLGNLHQLQKITIELLFRNDKLIDLCF